MEELVTGKRPVETGAGLPVRTSRRDGPFSRKALHDNGRPVKTGVRYALAVATARSAEKHCTTMDFLDGRLDGPSRRVSGTH